MRCSIGERGSAVCMPPEERVASTLSGGGAVSCFRLSGEEGASTALKFCYRSSRTSRTCHTSDKCYITRKGDWGVGRGQREIILNIILGLSTLRNCAKGW